MSPLLVCPVPGCTFQTGVPELWPECPTHKAAVVPGNTQAVSRGRWVQRPAGTRFPESRALDYHGCLDALIRTLRSMRITADVAKPHITNPGLLMIMEWDIRAAQERADICAGMLFDRWVEELPPAALTRGVEEMVRAQNERNNA